MKILGHNIKFKLVPSFEALGEWDLGSKTIVYRKNPFKSHTASATLLHEIVHAVIDFAELRHPLSLSILEEEIICDTIAVYFNDNYNLYYKEKDKGKYIYPFSDELYTPALKNFIEEACSDKCKVVGKLLPCYKEILDSKRDRKIVGMYDPPDKCIMADVINVQFACIKSGMHQVAYEVAWSVITALVSRVYRDNFNLVPIKKPKKPRHQR